MPSHAARSFEQSSSARLPPVIPHRGTHAADPCLLSRFVSQHPLYAAAQQAGKVYRVGTLTLVSDPVYEDLFAITVGGGDYVFLARIV
jgi:hypothetical protein